MNKLLLTSVIVLTATSLTACQNMPFGSHTAKPNHTAPMSKPAVQPNLVALAQSNPDLSILVEAVVAAGLVDALSDPSKQYTVLAPTNAAFASLLSELKMSKAQLLANKPLLTQVLTYHVIAQPVYAKDVRPGNVNMLNGATLRVNPNVTLTDGRGRNANIIKTDVKASNGVVHVIDKVLLPAS